VSEKIQGARGQLSEIRNQMAAAERIHLDLHLLPKKESLKGEEK
jgi:hypothetical protein